MLHHHCLRRRFGRRRDFGSRCSDVWRTDGGSTRGDDVIVCFLFFTLVAAIMRATESLDGITTGVMGAPLEGVWRGLSPAMPMFWGFPFMERLWGPANSTASDRNRTHANLPRFGPPEGKDLHPACLILYCWYMWRYYNGAQMQSGGGGRRWRG
jgi:hypothetical protein